MNAFSNIVFSVGGQNPIIQSFTTSNSAPETGTAYTLSWQTWLTSSVAISPIGNVALSGSTTLTAGPAGSVSSHELTAVGLNGRFISNSLSVSAGSPPPPPEPVCRWPQWGVC